MSTDRLTPAAESLASPAVRGVPSPPLVQAAPDGGEAQEAAACASCGTPATGAFCTHCGQEHARARVLSLREFVAESLDTFVSFDSKVLRSLVPLVARPGVLTREYLDGRRAPYLSPMKVFVVLNVAFFFLVQVFDPVTAEIALGSPEAVEQVAEARGASTAAFSARLEGEIADALPTWIFVIVPLFALGVAGLYAGSRRPVALHLVFAFHFMAFVLVAFAPGVVTRVDAANTAALLALPVYLVVALRRVHRQSWPTSVAKGLAAALWFYVLLYLYYVVVVGLALARV